MSAPAHTSPSLQEIHMEAIAHNFAVPHFGDIPLACVIPSKTNPRKNFEPTALEELATSIKQHGIAQPILVRPMADAYVELDGTQVACVEIVAGERRYRAAKMAGLETVPAIVRALTDVQALELQILENLQRKDVHEIEEAEGYDRLMKEAGYTADQLAEKVGKSRSYIYGRLKFCALAPAAREAFFDGRLNASTALLIARIPVPELQAKAAEEIVKPTFGNEPMSYRNAVAHVRNRYMLDLEDAPFDTTDAKLVKAAGACHNCPKRAGANPLLYVDIDPDVCTDPDCFNQKKVVHFEKVLAKAEKKKLPIFEAEGWYQNARAAGFLSISQTQLRDFERPSPDQSSWAYLTTLIEEDQLPAPAAYAKMHNGSVQPLYTKHALQEALEAAGICETVEQREAREAAEEAERNSDGDVGSEGRAPEDRKASALPAKTKEELKAEQLTAYRVRVYKALREKLLESGDPTVALRAAVGMISDELHYAMPDAISDLHSFQGGVDIGTHFANASAVEIAVYLMDVSLNAEAVEVSSWDIKNEETENDDYLRMVAMAEQAGVDLAVLEPPADDELEAPAEPEPPKKGRGKKAKKEAEPANAAENWPFPVTGRP